MTTFDPHNSWLALEQRAQRETDPRLRTLVTAVRDHMEYEITGRLDDLMTTLTADPIYHFWGNGEPNVIAGREAVRAFYAGMMAAGGQQFEVVTDNILATPTHVVTEGQVKQIYRGAGLLAMGIQDVGGETIDPDQLFMSRAQLVTVWPADPEGKLIGEDIYFGQAPMTTLTPVGADVVPDYYVFH